MNSLYEVERFHFKLDEDLYLKLKDFADYWGESISDAVDRIVSKVYFLIEKVEYESCFIDRSTFGEEELVMDKDLKISIKKKFKSKFFNMQARFRLKSKASLLRFIIRKYFEKKKKFYKNGYLRLDVRKRLYWMWVKKIKRLSYASYLEWSVAKSGHMNYSDTPQIIYIMNRNNEIRDISYINIMKNKKN